MTEFWMDKEEQEFLMSHLNDTQKMLEWGSGNSTLILQDTVRKLVSVEHHQGWYNKLKPQLKDNVEYLYVPPTNPIWEQQFNPNGTKNPAGDDGSFEDFASYVLAPSRTTNPIFDTIFIDGRARVACAWAAMFILAPDGFIFMHDFGPEAHHPHLSHRTYYDIVMEWLEPVDRVKTMGKFKVRQ